MNRRQLLKALGLLPLASSARGALGAEVPAPSRIVFFVQPHGHVPKGWNVPFAGLGYDASGEADLGQVMLPEVLQPLAPFARKLLVVEGLSHLTQMFDIAEVTRSSGDLNNHQVAVADLLTGVRAAQTHGARCTGGGRSLDQELAARLGGPGRFGSRVYGADYVPNQTVSPFSYLDARQATPVVYDPQQAFADLAGLAGAGAGVGGTRAQRLAAMRGSVLDVAAGEYAAAAKTLGSEGRSRLEQHRQLVRDLETSLTVTSPRCALSFDASGDRITQFMRLTRLALSCDLTRVVTYVAPVPKSTELGYPADADVHGSYAHASIEGATSCGTTFSPVAERAMIDLGTYYARHFAMLLSELDSVREGDGTLLDHTAVVWLTELGTPTHEHNDVFTLIAGGCNGFFRTGRYVRYGRTLANQLPSPKRLGPSQNRLFVSLLQAMGQSATQFGLPEVRADDGTIVSMRGALVELHSS